jgi:hypothetical protein
MLPRFFIQGGCEVARSRLDKSAETFVARGPSHGAAAGQVPGKIQK